MALSNADRQKRHRERVKAALARPGGAAPGPNLSAELASDRDAVASEPLWPVPQGAAKDQMPRFLGWTRYEWSRAPAEMVDFFGLREAWDGWAAEEVEMDRRIAARGAELEREADAVVAECGTIAAAIRRERGSFGLLGAYHRDPTLGGKAKKTRTKSAVTARSPKVQTGTGRPAASR